MSAAARRWLAGAALRATLVVSACAFVVPALTASPSTLSIAHADEAPPALVLDIDSLTPLAPLPSSTLTVSGTVANRSAEPVPAVTLRLRVGRQIIDGRAVLAQISGGQTDTVGSVVENTRTQPITLLLPGQSATFTITAPMATLELDGSGVHLLTVEAQSDPGDGNLARMGLLRTFLPYFPDPASTPVTGLVTLWPLSDPTPVTSDGVLLDDQLPTDLSPGGRLRVLLETGAAHASAVSWVVDPALLDTVASMADGYRINDDGDITVGTRPQDAAAWIDQLRRATARADVAALPYAVPDDVALVRGGLERDVVHSISSAGPAASQQLQRPLTSVLAWPTNGLVDEATLRTLVDAAPRGVLISGGQLRSSSDVTPSGTAPIPGSAGAATAVVPDLTLSSILASTRQSPTSPVLARQRLLAELAQIGMEVPQSRTVVMSPPMTWTPRSAFVTELLTAIASVPWVRPTGLGTLLGSEPSSITRELQPYPSDATVAELPPVYVSRIQEAQLDVAAVGDVVAGSAGTTMSLRAALARASSGWFRRDLRRGGELIARTSDAADVLLAGIRIVSKGGVTLPGDTGIIPLSIANTLDSPVTLTLNFVANPSVRLTAGPVAPITIPAGTTTLVEVPARVSGSGQVALSVRLASTSGHTFGAPAELQVGTSAYARAAGWVVAVFFGILVILLGANAVRRIHGARRRPVGDDA